MAFDVADVEQFLAALREHPEWRDRVRDEILGQDFLALPGIVARLGERLDALTEEVRLLTEAQRKSEERLGRVEGRLGWIEGRIYEQKFNAPARLAKTLRRVRAVALSDLDEVQDAHERGLLFDRDLDQPAALDHLLIGRPKGTQADVYVAFEVPTTVDLYDVERAAQRAEILRRAGLPAQAWVGGRRVTDGAQRRAEELGVSIDVDRSEPVDEPAA